MIITASVVVKEELANETVNYDTEIKAYQFEPEAQVIKKGFERKKRFDLCFRGRSPE